MKCKYCHKPAGWFSFKHKECEERHNHSLQIINTTIKERLNRPDDCIYNSIKEELAQIISEGYVTQDVFYNAIYRATIESLTQDNQNIFIIYRFINSLPNEVKEDIYTNQNYISYIVEYFEKYIKSECHIDSNYSNLIKELKFNNKITEQIDKVFVSFIDNKILQILNEGTVSHEEEEEINNYIESFVLDESETLYDSDMYNKFVQSLILRDIQEGKRVERMKLDHIPILLGKNEYILWAFNNIDGYEEKTGRRFVGGSQGISTRICKGVYYRIGSSKGHSIEYQYQNPLGRGLWIITNKNIYFLGQKQVKIGISKILSYEPYSDGLVIVKDGINPKPYTFIGFDSWFAVNAMHLLAE